MVLLFAGSRSFCGRVFVGHYVAFLWGCLRRSAVDCSLRRSALRRNVFVGHDGVMESSSVVLGVGDLRRSCLGCGVFVDRLCAACGGARCVLGEGFLKLQGVMGGARSLAVSLPVRW